MKTLHLIYAKGSQVTFTVKYIKPGNKRDSLLMANLVDGKM